MYSLANASKILRPKSFCRAVSISSLSCVISLRIVLSTVSEIIDALLSIKSFLTLAKCALPSRTKRTFVSARSFLSSWNSASSDAN